MYDKLIIAVDAQIAALAPRFLAHRAAERRRDPRSAG